MGLIDAGAVYRGRSDYGPNSVAVQVPPMCAALLNVKRCKARMSFVSLCCISRGVLTSRIMHAAAAAAD